MQAHPAACKQHLSPAIKHATIISGLEQWRPVRPPEIVHLSLHRWNSGKNHWEFRTGQQDSEARYDSSAM